MKFLDFFIQSWNYFYRIYFRRSLKRNIVATYFPIEFIDFALCTEIIADIKFQLRYAYENRY